MIDNLPVELMTMVIHKLVPRPPIDYCSTRDVDEDLPHTKVRTWDAPTGNHNDLVSLALTCRTLKSIVYPFLYKSLACCTPYTNFLMFALTCYDTCGPFDRRYTGLKSMIRNIFEQFENLTLPLVKPQYRLLSPDVLKHVQSLFFNLTFFKGPSKCWVSQFFQNMTSLKQVTAIVEFRTVPIKKTDLIVAELLAHKTLLKVHLSFNFLLQVNVPAAATLEKLFETEWAAWTNLDIEFLGMYFCYTVSYISPLFIQISQKFKSLKTVVIKQFALDEFFAKPYKTPRPIIREDNSDAISLLLDDLRRDSKESITEEQTLQDDKKTLGSSCNLSIPLSMLDSTRTFEMFDNITQLEISTKFSQLDGPEVRPPFRKLKTLGLYHCEIPKAVELLNHLVACNPSLTKLVMDQGSLIQDHAFLSRVFANLQQMHCFHVKHLSFHDLVLCAPRLQHLTITPGTCDLDSELVNVMQAFIGNKLSKALDTVEVMQMLEWDREVFSNSLAWARSVLEAFVPSDVAGKAVQPPAVPDWSRSSFVLDFRLLRKHLHPGGTGPVL